MNPATQTSSARPRNTPGAELVPERLDDLVILRLATQKKPVSKLNLADQLRGLAPSTYSDAHWHETVEQSLSRLRADGQLDDEGLVTTAEPAKKRLGLRGPLKWKEIVERRLAGLALAIAPGDSGAYKRLRKHDDWAGAVVARFQGVWQQGLPPSWGKTCDCLVWRSFDLSGNPKKSPPEIRAFVLGKILGQSVAPPGRLLRYLAAREVGAVRSDLEGLREGLVRRWLAGKEWTGDERVAPPLPLAAFGDVVRQAASRATEGLFGRRKVFIAHLWRSLRTHPAVGAMSLEQFKRQLVAANRNGLLALSRADLVATMNPQDVADSETTHLEARYHFVEREEAP